MAKQKILFVAHCILNISSKVVMWEYEDMAAEEDLRKKFLMKAIPQDVQLVQLPCPEFTMYGARRWGHVSDQFDNVFFRNHCRKILEPVLDQMEEYLSEPDRFEVLGIAGVDGSPSCGVDLTCESKEYYGSLGGHKDPLGVYKSIQMTNKNGVLISVLREMLDERGIDVPIRGLFAPEPEKVMSFLE